MKALIVDDSSTMRRIIKKALQEMGMDSVEAGDGNEALASLRSAPDIDFVLLDWNMPNMNGFDTLKAIKADAATASIPVLMVTTEAERSQVVKAIQAGAKQYVVKPFTTDILVEKIKKALEVE